MKEIYTLAGNWKVTLADGSNYDMVLPGTLDTNNIGYADKGANQWHPEINLGNATEEIDEHAPIATRFTRKHTYEGAATLTRQISYVPTPGMRVLLEAERARCLRLWIDDREVEPLQGSGTLSTPYVFEVTGLLTGNNKITLVSDNSYPGLPHDDIVYSSAATDETQTNWNGILGYFRLREVPETYIESVHVYPRGENLDIAVTLSTNGYFQDAGKLTIESEAIDTITYSLTLGNELHNHELGHARMVELVEMAQQMDNTRMYAIASNGYYGEQGCDETSDFYTSQKYYKEEIRGCFAAESDTPGQKGHLLGYINNRYPGSDHNYDSAMSILRKDYSKPVFSFEVGQYEILPDFGELQNFQGISDPANLRLVQKRVEEAGLTKIWKEYVEATGELSLIGYREEVEAVMRTKAMSGISLLGLQDFPGQGTALVGMMNSHLEAKPYDFARPERFRQFFRGSLPLVEMEKYTYEFGETLTAKILAANYGKQDMEGRLQYRLSGGGKEYKGYLNNMRYEKGNLTLAGEIQIPITQWTKAQELSLEVELSGEAHLYNQYPVWVYPKVQPQCPDTVYETRYPDEQARHVLEQGGTVYLSPDATAEALPHSIRTQFTTDFWSVGTFAAQEGGMGQYIDTQHPIFASFPTQKHTNWQWWCMATQRAVILPRAYRAIVTEMDSYAYLRPMAQLIEWRCGKGKVLLSTFGLHNLQQYPEARALQDSIYRYLASGQCEPEQTITIEELAHMVHGQS